MGKTIQEIEQEFDDSFDAAIQDYVESCQRQGRTDPLELTDEQKIQIAKWEQDNWFCAAMLQKECISYEHYLTEVLNEIESDTK